MAWDVMAMKGTVLVPLLSVSVDTVAEGGARWLKVCILNGTCDVMDASMLEEGKEESVERFSFG